MSLANRLNQIIDEQKISKREFAKRVGVSENYVYTLTGESNKITTLSPMLAFDRIISISSSSALTPMSVKGCLTIIGEYGVSLISVESRARAVSLTSAKFVCFRIVFLLSAEIKKRMDLIDPCA